jgi:type I restriction enzyme S subunit
MIKTQEFSIGSIGQVITGTTPPTTQNHLWGGSIDFLTPSDIEGFDFNVKTERSVTRSSTDYYSPRIIENNGLAVVCIASVGKIARINRPTLTNQQINTIIPNAKIADRDYLFYLFTFFESYLKRFAGGSVAPLLPKSDFERIVLKLPGTEFQRESVKILLLIDEQVEDILAMVSNLRDMSSLIFEYWFLQFEFPNDDNRPYSSAGGMLETMKNFSSAVPSEWNVSNLRTILNVDSGYSFQASDYSEDGEYSLVTIRNVKDGYLDTLSQNKITLQDIDIPDYCFLKKGDVLISLTGNVGRTAMVDRDKQVLNQRVGKLRCADNYKYFAYLYLLRPEVKKRLISIANGSSQDNLSPNDVFDAHFPVPPEGVLEKFNSILDPIFQQILILQEELNVLKELKEFLKPHQLRYSLH